MPRCPVCGGPVDLATALTPPFCGDRCRTIDLGRWLDEAYSLPERPRDPDDEHEDDQPADRADQADDED